MLLFQPWKIILVVVVCLAGLILALPNLISRESAEGLPGWLPSQQISLGLDLQGGSHLLLEVDTAAVIRATMAERVFARPLRTFSRNPVTAIAHPPAPFKTLSSMAGSTM